MRGRADARQGLTKSQSPCEDSLHNDWARPWPSRPASRNQNQSKGLVRILLPREGLAPPENLSGTASDSSSGHALHGAFMSQDGGRSHRGGDNLPFDGTHHMFTVTRALTSWPSQTESRRARASLQRLGHQSFNLRPTRCLVFSAEPAPNENSKPQPKRQRCPERCRP